MNWIAHQLPSIGLSLWGVLVFTLAGNKRRVAWACGMAGQAFWLTYAIWLHQWGLIIGCGLYGGTYLRNWVKWKPVAAEPVPCACGERTVTTCWPNDDCVLCNPLEAQAK